MKSLLLASCLGLATLAPAAVTENFTQNHPLNEEGVVSLDNVNGPVEIIGWDKNEVSIEAVKEATNSEALQRIEIKVEATPDQVTIRTVHDKTWKFWDTFQASVQYKLHVPAKARLDKINTVNANITVSGVRGAMNLDTTNGNIKATGLRADVRLDSVNGTLTAEFASLKKVGAVKLESVNGRIELSLPKDASASLTTRTVNGSTHVDQAIKLTKSGKLGVAGQIGEGGPAITLITVNGGISVLEK